MIFDPTDPADPAAENVSPRDSATSAPPAVSAPVPSPPPPSAAMLEARGIHRVFRMGATQLEVLRGVDLAIYPGDMRVILGASGAGKSTLLHILGLLDTPTAGQLFFENQDLARFNVERQAAVRNQRFGFVFQFYHLLPEFTALENVLMPRMIQNGPIRYLSRKNEFVDRAKHLLTNMGLGSRLKHRPAQLSGGERQRVAIARALINDPAIVFCDEPTGNLDSRTAGDIHDQLRALNRDQGQTFVIVTHNERFAQAGEKVCWMHDGNLFESRSDLTAAISATHSAIAAAAAASAAAHTASPSADSTASAATHP